MDATSNAGFSAGTCARTMLKQRTVVDTAANAIVVVKLISIGGRTLHVIHNKNLNQSLSCFQPQP